MISVNVYMRRIANLCTKLLRMDSQQLIADLLVLCHKHLQQAQTFKECPLQQLNAKRDAEAWSVLECLEHLNLYGHFYIPTLREKISSSTLPAVPNFTPGWFGNYSANSMLPKEKLNKMKTFKDKNPSGSKLGISSIDEFIEQTKQFIELLELAKKVNLNRIRVPLTLPLLRFKLGDTLRFVVYHNERHMVQAQKALQNAIS